VVLALAVAVLPGACDFDSDRFLLSAAEADDPRVLADLMMDSVTISGGEDHSDSTVPASRRRDPAELRSAALATEAVFAVKWRESRVRQLVPRSLRLQPAWASVQESHVRYWQANLPASTVCRDVMVELLAGCGSSIVVMSPQEAADTSRELRTRACTVVSEWTVSETNADAVNSALRCAPERAASNDFVYLRFSGYG
jgi:hypothetical protein